MPRIEMPILPKFHKIIWKQLKECGMRFSKELRTGLSGSMESNTNFSPNFSKSLVHTEDKENPTHWLYSL